jgi:hypothetical protein
MGVICLYNRITYAISFAHSETNDPQWSRSRSPGLRLDAERFGADDDSACPSCGARGGRKLDGDRLAHVAYIFFVQGTDEPLPTAPLVQFNDRQKTSISAPGSAPHRTRRWALGSSRSRVRFVRIQPAVEPPRRSRHNDPRQHDHGDCRREHHLRKKRQLEWREEIRQSDHHRQERGPR